MAARALFDAGECFVRVRSRYSSDGLSVPVQLQLLEAEQLDETYNELLSSGNQIKCGIEFDAIGRRVAYWFWSQHPGDLTVTGYKMERTRVPAQSVFHIYKPLRPGQIRGRPWLTAGMIKLHDLDLYDDFELARKKGAAMFMGFLKTGLATEAQIDKVLTGDDQQQQDAAYAQRVGSWLSNYMTMEPSVLQALPDGFDIQFSQPADVGPNYESFQLRNLYAVCASMGLPYHAVTGDVSRANYSSLRASLIEVRRRIEQFQWETLIFQFCRQVWRAWVPLAVGSGAVNLPGFRPQSSAVPAGQMDHPAMGLGRSAERPAGREARRRLRVQGPVRRHRSLWRRSA
jgi:lambda family phage portal protein